MFEPLDVFAVKNGEVAWVGCAATLEKGLQLAVTHGAGLYFIFSQQTGQKNFYKVAQQSVIAVQETEGAESQRSLANFD